jgi:aspartate-semialdehyde dehydrogenase
LAALFGGSCGNGRRSRNHRNIRSTKLAELRTRSRVAVVGGDTLLAKELRELLEESKPAPSIELISAAADNAAVLGAEEDEAVVMSPLTKESLAGAQVAFLVGSAASSRRALKLNPPDGPVLIDLTAALEEQPNARLRAPSAEPGPVSHPGEIQVIAHPAAIAVAMLLSSLAQRTPIRKSIIHIFEPASERGRKGLDELQQQTVAVLSFQKLKTDVFDAQLGFNLLARYGEEAIEPLEDVEERIARHLASLLAAYPAIPMPSLRLVQAPVFHGHSVSVWVELEEDPGPQAFSESLAAAGIDVRPDEPPSNVSIAGQSGLSVGAITPDANQPRAYWLWLVSDNFKIAAENALAVARELLP